MKNRDDLGIQYLYDQYANMIFGLIFRMVKRQDIAENVLQDTFLKVWNRIDTFDASKGKFLTWIFNIARNTAIDTLRSKSYQQETKLSTLEVSQLDNQTKYSATLKVDHLDIREIVGRLDVKYRKIIELVYFGEYTHVEVSKELKIPLGTVKSRIRKAFSELKIMLA